MHPSFIVARETADNLGNAFRRTRDENAIETILSEAIDTGNPEVLQNSIGKILSQVSPERQGPAIQYLQSAYKNIEAKKQQENKMRQEQLAAKQAGYTPGVPPQVAAAQVRENAKQNRLAQYGLGGDPRSQYNLPNAEFGTPAQLGGIRGQDESQIQQQQSPRQSIPNLEDMSDQQLRLLTGAPDREISIPARAILRAREEEKNLKKPLFEAESDKLEAKRVSELAENIESEYIAAKNEDLRLDRQIKLDEKGNLSTPSLIKVLDSIGLPIGILGNPDTEEYRKLEADYTRDVSKVFPGGKITNYELMSYLKTIPSLLNSSEGRKAIVRNRKLLNEAKRVRYDEYVKIIKENNGKKPPNLGILLDERTFDKINDIENRFREGIEKESEKFQQPIRMIDPQGNLVDIPPNLIEKAMKAGAKFS